MEQQQWQYHYRLIGWSCNRGGCGYIRGNLYIASRLHQDYNSYGTKHTGSHHRQYSLVYGQWHNVPVQ